MKKLNCLRFLLILALLIGCSQPRVEIYNLEDRLTRFNANGSLIIDLEGEPISGLAFQNHKDGTLKLKLFIKEGIPHGSALSYFENGQLWQKGEFKNGKLDGLLEMYYENGQLDGKVTYKNGEKDGLYEMYFDNGQLWEKGEFKNGKMDGLYERYNKYGQIMLIRIYEEGLLISDSIIKN